MISQLISRKILAFSLGLLPVHSDRLGDDLGRKKNPEDTANVTMAVAKGFLFDTFRSTRHVSQGDKKMSPSPRE